MKGKKKAVDKGPSIAVKPRVGTKHQVADPLSIGPFELGRLVSRLQVEMYWDDGDWNPLKSHGFTVAHRPLVIDRILNALAHAGLSPIQLPRKRKVRKERQKED